MQIQPLKPPATGPEKSRNVLLEKFLPTNTAQGFVASPRLSVGTVAGPDSNLSKKLKLGLGQRLGLEASALFSWFGKEDHHQPYPPVGAGVRVGEWRSDSLGGKDSGR